MATHDDIYRELHGTLKRYWGYDSFRPVQEEIIRSVCDGRDTLALMPTGGGKSLTYQVPTMLREGLCIVVTPLIALMKDQVDRLRQLGINAVAIHSGITMRQIDIALDNCVYGDVKFLYVAPERLVTEAFRLRVERMRVSLIAVDEAHCISQWGYDFRPSYLRIAELRERLPETPMLALTASATPVVADDIMRQLRFAAPHILRSSFARPNLSYAVRHDEDKNEQLLRVLRNVAGSGIVYVRTRDGCEQLTEFLRDEGIRATYYHGGLANAERTIRQEEWLAGRSRIMVATNAFGMGIDKADVRFVVHYAMPDSLESYYQEAGRAGRDGLPSRCILLYSGTDVRTIRFFIDKEMEADNGLPADVKAEAARKAEERLKYMTFYSTTQKCLRRFMLNYFGEAAPEKCGNCSCCLFAEQNAQEVEQRAAAAKQRAAANSRRLSARRAAAGGDLSEADEKLLAALYALRKRLAAKQNLPAYMVFSDATLREMVQSKPLSMDEFLNITGVGEKKAARYGMAFLRSIEDMVGSRE